MINKVKTLLVVPYVGTWIEIFAGVREAGGEEVVPYVGTWIEMAIVLILAHLLSVVPYVGTWIEMCRYYV